MTAAGMPGSQPDSPCRQAKQQGRQSPRKAATATPHRRWLPHSCLKKRQGREVIRGEPSKNRYPQMRQTKAWPCEHISEKEELDYRRGRFGFTMASD